LNVWNAVGAENQTASVVIIEAVLLARTCETQKRTLSYYPQLKTVTVLSKLVCTVIKIEILWYESEETVQKFGASEQTA
jgi:hypothetical protein